MATLKDADISIRRRGLDLLFTMCNNQNVRDIVDELLKYLEIADFTMRDELVLKTAVLAERYCPCPDTQGGSVHWSFRAFQGSVLSAELEADKQGIYA